MGRHAKPDPVSPVTVRFSASELTLVEDIRGQMQVFKKHSVVTRSDAVRYLVRRAIENLPED